MLVLLTETVNSELTLSSDRPSEDSNSALNILGTLKRLPRFL